MDDRRRIGRGFAILGFVVIAGIVLFLFFRAGGVAPSAGEAPASTSNSTAPQAATDSTVPPSTEAEPAETSTSNPATTTTAGQVSRYDPVAAGEPLPDGYRTLLPRDAIMPVYQPSFVRAQDAPWDPEVLVIGVVIDDEARAYPVSYLNHREMVIDSLAGIPILVTW
jgi:hypothetical protein